MTYQTKLRSERFLSLPKALIDKCTKSEGLVISFLRNHCNKYGKVKDDGKKWTSIKRKKIMRELAVSNTTVKRAIAVAIKSGSLSVCAKDQRCGNATRFYSWDEKEYKKFSIGEALAAQTPPKQIEQPTPKQAKETKKPFEKKEEIKKELTRDLWEKCHSQRRAMKGFRILMRKEGELGSDGKMWACLPLEYIAAKTKTGLATVKRMMKMAKEKGFITAEAKRKREGDCSLHYVFHEEEYLKSLGKKNNKKTVSAQIAEKPKMSKKVAPPSCQKRQGKKDKKAPSNKELIKYNNNYINYIRENSKNFFPQKKPYNSHQQQMLELLESINSELGIQQEKDKKVFQWIGQTLKFFKGNKEAFINYIKKLGRSKYWRYIKEKKFFTNIFSLLRFDFIKRILEQTKDDISCSEKISDTTIKETVKAHQEQYRYRPVVLACLQRLEKKIGSAAYFSQIVHGHTKVEEDGGSIFLYSERPWTQNFLDFNRGNLIESGFSLASEKWALS